MPLRDRLSTTLDGFKLKFGDSAWFGGGIGASYRSYSWPSYADQARTPDIGTLRPDICSRIRFLPRDKATVQFWRWASVGRSSSLPSFLAQKLYYPYMVGTTLRSGYDVRQQRWRKKMH